MAVATIDDLDDAHRVQLGVLDLWEQVGERVGGWKVAFTSAANQHVADPVHRPFGYVLDSRIHSSGVTLPDKSISACRLEPEICLVLGTPLGGPDVDEAAAKKAVAGVAAAFEIIEQRRRARDTPLSVRVADGINNWGIVVSDPIEPPDWDLRSSVVRTTSGGQVVNVSSSTDGLIDDPYLSLARLCRTLDRFGRTLRAGDRVITGAFSVHDVEGPGSWTAEFSGIGTVEITFSKLPVKEVQAKVDRRG